MLELAKALSFLACVLSLYWTAVNAFFLPGIGWQDRLFLALAKLVLAACICSLSGLIFRWPSPTNPDRNQPLHATLPVQLFLWIATGLLLFFIATWYLTCGAPTFTNHYPACT